MPKSENPNTPEKLDAYPAIVRASLMGILPDLVARYASYWEGLPVNDSHAESLANDPSFQLDDFVNFVCRQPELIHIQGKVAYSGHVEVDMTDVDTGATLTDDEVTPDGDYLPLEVPTSTLITVYDKHGHSLGFASVNRYELCGACGKTWAAHGVSGWVRSDNGKHLACTNKPTPDDCIHPDLFSDSGPLDKTHYCPNCGGDIPNREL